jgi:CRISPR-associated protein Cas2
MARRRYLIAYDISDDKRLRRVIKIMEAFGLRLQYSVFICDLTGAELVDWQSKILAAVKLSEDSIVRIDLGALPGSATIHTLGTPRRIPAPGPVIV